MSNTGSKREGSTLNIGALREGVVLDHIRAGYAMTIYKYLKLDKEENAILAAAEFAKAREVKLKIAQ